MDSKMILITGANSGIGLATAFELAKKGHHICMLGRNIQKMHQLKERWERSIPNAGISYLFCDLSDFSSVQKAAMQLMMMESKINVLINNAGGIFPEYQKNKDGFENTIAVNHLGHFLLTISIMPILKESNARIINVSSEAHKAARIDWSKMNDSASYQSFNQYALAKLFNIGFTRSLHDKFNKEGVSSFALHPGVVKTGFGKEYEGWVKWLIRFSQPFMISAEKGAETSIFLTTQNEASLSSGAYYIKSKQALPSTKALSKEFQNDLWDYSMKAVSSYLPG